MNALLLKLMGRVYRNEATDGGDSGGGGTSEPAASDAGFGAADWEALNDGVAPGADDEDGEGSEAPAPSPAPAASTAAPAPAPAASTEPATGTDPVEQDPAAQPQTPVEPAEQQLTPEQIAAQNAKIAEDFAKWEQAEIQRLATEVYTFDEETAARLQTEPELVLPQLAARLQLQATRNALEAVQRMLPQIIPQMMQQTTTEKSAMEAFYGANPDLRQYHEQVLTAGKMFRKLNPKAKPEEAIKRIGDMVRMSLGLNAPAATPAASPAPAGKPAGRVAPHRPAQPGGGSGTKVQKAQPQGDAAFWGEMADGDD